MHLAKEPPHSVAYLEGELMPKAAALQLGMSLRPDGSACEDHLVIGAASGDVLICDLKRRFVMGACCGCWQSHGNPTLGDPSWDTDTPCMWIRSAACAIGNW